MPGEQRKSGHGGWWFLAIVVAGYILFGLLQPDTMAQALAFFLHVMQQVLPILGLVFLLLLIANLLLQPAWIRRNLGKGSGIRGWLAAVFGGILSLGPIYPWYAMLGELREKGMRRALIAAFLYSRAVKPALLPLMIYYFGVTYTVIVCLYLIAFAIVSGIVVEKLLPGETD
jgi:uncharacterized membrane protein YraQ (UPF0718 family)